MNSRRVNMTTQPPPTDAQVDDWPFQEVYDAQRNQFQRSVFQAHPLVGHLDFQYGDAKKGYFRIDIPWQENLSNYGQEMHGGIHAVLVDSVSGQAIYSLLKKDFGLSTVSLNTQYHRPFKKGVMKAEGWVTRWGRNVCHTQAKLSVDDLVIAEGSTVYSIFEHNKSQRSHWVKERTQPS